MMNFVGCDIGKHSFDVSLNGKHFKFENDADGIIAFVDKCKTLESPRVIMEPTGGYERKLIKCLCSNDIATSLVNPYFVRNFARSKKDLAKTDKIDCKVLAEYGEKMEPRVYIPKAEHCFELEDLCHRRDNIVEMIKQEKQRLEKDPPEFVKESIGQILVCLETEKKKIEIKLQECVDANEQAQKISEVLQSEKGIGPQTAAILIGQLPELGRLDKQRIGKLCGLAPMSHDSGMMHGERSVRGGRDRVREALYMASISAIRSNPKLREFYQRLRAKGKPAKVAITAVARKLVVILNAKIRCFYEENEGDAPKYTPLD
jgi:transposase